MQARGFLDLSVDEIRSLAVGLKTPALPWLYPEGSAEASPSRVSAARDGLIARGLVRFSSGAFQVDAYLATMIRATASPGALVTALTSRATTEGTRLDASWLFMVRGSHRRRDQDSRGP